jgi:hypothetical protein
MNIKHTTLLTTALLSAAALLAAPAIGAKAEKKADLALQRITLGPKFVVVKPNGKATAEIPVTLSIRNVGHARAGASTTLVRLLQGTRKVAQDEIPLAALAPGHASTQIAIFHDAEPQLGMLRAAAKADVDNKVSGPLENDFRSTHEIPVIAQRWGGSMESEVKTPGIFSFDEDDNATTPDITFKFSGVDGLHRFVYTVGGTVKQTATFSGKGCTGEGETSATMAKWGKDSGLYLSHDLTQYEAVIRGSLGPPFTVNVTCPDVPTPTPVRIIMKDLLTEKSIGGLRQPMKPSARVLEDLGTLGAIITITNQWHLVADVP